MRVLALLLVVMVPSLALAQAREVKLLPSNELPTPAALVSVEPEVPLHQRWYVWAGAGTATVVLAVVVGIVASGVASQRASPPFRKSDFTCNPKCDGFINPPPQ
jgi:hypothetical protein